MKKSAKQQSIQVVFTATAVAALLAFSSKPADTQSFNVGENWGPRPAATLAQTWEKLTNSDKLTQAEKDAIQFAQNWPTSGQLAKNAISKKLNENNITIVKDNKLSLLGVNEDTYVSSAEVLENLEYMDLLRVQAENMKSALSKIAAESGAQSALGEKISELEGFSSSWDKELSTGTRVRKAAAAVALSGDARNAGVWAAKTGTSIGATLLKIPFSTYQKKIPLSTYENLKSLVKADKVLSANVAKIELINDLFTDGTVSMSEISETVESILAVSDLDAPLGAVNSLSELKQVQSDYLKLVKMQSIVVGEDAKIALANMETALLAKYTASLVKFGNSYVQSIKLVVGGGAIADLIDSVAGFAQMNFEADFKLEHEELFAKLQSSQRWVQGGIDFFSDVTSSNLLGEMQRQVDLPRYTPIPGAPLTLQGAPEVATDEDRPIALASQGVGSAGQPSDSIPIEAITPASVIIENRILEIQRRRAEEAAQAERERQAEQRRQARLAAIAALEAERTKQFLVKLDAEARLKNNDNRLAILNFDEREEVQRVLTVVDTESARLRNLQNTSGISAADATRLQAIMAYGEVLEAEMDRIAAEERTLQGSNTALQSSLATANSIIVNNSNQLNALNYDWNGFTIPSYSANLTDWSTFNYELPPFDLTPTPSSTVKNGFLAAVSTTPSSTFSITNTTTVTLPAAGSGQLPTVNSNNRSLTVAAITPAIEDYQYLSFGSSTFAPSTEISVTNPVTDPASGTVHSFTNIHWLYGDTTPPAYMQTKTGTAHWSGQIYGDYALWGTDRMFYNAVTGSLKFSVNFSDRSVTGDLITAINYDLSPTHSVSKNANFRISGLFHLNDFPDPTGTDIKMGVNASILSFDDSINGGLKGQFFGPSAQEFGGTFGFIDEHGSAVGIAAAKESAAPVVNPPIASPKDYSNYKGLIAYNGFAYDGSRGYTIYKSGLLGVSLEARTSGTVSFSPDMLPVADETMPGYVRPPEPVNGKTGGFDHTNWGEWDYDAGYKAYIAGDLISAPSADWVGYDPTINLQTSGTASYQGVAYGRGPTQPNGRVSGEVSISADFQNDTVSGTLSLDHSGGGWADTTFATNIVRGNGNIAFQGILQGADVSGGNIFGGFAGPSAEEVAGGWQISKTDGSSAIGIFAAKEQ